MYAKGRLFAYTSTTSTDTSAGFFPIKLRKVATDFRSRAHSSPRRCVSCRTWLDLFDFHEARIGTCSRAVFGVNY
jgi:hypothetical protein